MSDINSEDSTPNMNNPSNSGGNQTPGHVDPILAQRLGNVPRTAASSQPWSQILTVLDQIRYLNDRVRINTETTAKFLSEHMRDINRAQSITSDVQKQASRENPTFSREQLIPQHQKEFDQRREAVLRTLQTGTAAEQASQLKSLGIVHPDKIEETLKEFHSNNAKMMGEQFGTKLNDALVRQVAATATPEQQELATALAKISSGEGLLGRVRETLHLGHGISMGVPGRRPVGASGGGGYGKGGGDFAEGPYGHDGMDSTTIGLSRQARLLQKLSAREGVVGSVGSGLTKFLGAEGGIAGMIPELVPAVVGYELLKNFGRDIPIVGTTVAGTREFINQKFGREALQTGQLTGEDRGAGYGARLDAARLTPGGILSAFPVIGGIAQRVGGIFHPFDPITNQIATEIVQSVRTQGFTGPRARELYQGVADVYRDLGLSIDQTTKMITEATRNGGESLGQIVTEMKTFDNAAKNLGININQYAESISNTATIFRAGGAGATATTQAQQFVAGAPRILREGAGLQVYTQSFQNAAPFLSARLGLPQQFLQLPQNLGRTLPMLEELQNEEFQRMPGNTPGEKAANAGRLGIIFRGMGVDQILAIMRQNAAGRGPAGIARLEGARTSYATDLTRIRGRHNVAIRDLTPDQLAAEGIRRVQHSAGHGEMAWRYIQDGQAVDPNRMISRSVDLSSLPMGQVAAARRTAIESVRNLLNAKQYSELEKHINDRGYKFGERLHEFETGKGTGKNSLNTPFGEIKISFTGKAQKALKAEVVQNQRNYQYGVTQPNQSFPFPEGRIDPLGP